MKISVNGTKSIEIKELLNDLPRRIMNVATEVGRAIAEKSAAEVQRKLGGRGGWVRIYYNSIVHLENSQGGEWAIAGLNETRPDLFEYPAETSLLTFEAPTSSDTNKLVPIVANQNPWPIDVIPVLLKPYAATATVRMVDEGTVETYRAARLKNLPSVIEALQAAGGQVDTSGNLLVMIDRVYADIAYLAKRLELGFSGYPRVPHWGPAVSKTASSGEKWGSSPAVVRLAQEAIKGKEPGEVATMSPGQAAEFARIREASWS